MFQAEKQQVVSSDGSRQFCSFYLQGKLFGVNICHVKEICDRLTFTKIPHTPKTMRGYMNIRGLIYLVLDLRVMLGFDSQAVDHRSRVIIFKSTVGEAFGVLVDEVSDVLEVSQDQIENLPGVKHEDENSFEKSSSIITEICKLKEFLLIIINFEKLYRYEH